MTPDRALLTADKPFSIAILAMGGQGGGVLADWIVALGEANGWIVQATSVPGVAQRTGATIYYIEMIQDKPGRRPVLALMPTPGDVDVVMAAELIEAGRSVLRGLVTPDRTVLIASTHRSFAVVEKQKPGDGRVNSSIVFDATAFAAKRSLAFDMEKLAVQAGSVISAPMFGALAAAKLLPFAKEAFEATILSSGKAGAASLTAFRAAYDEAAALQTKPHRKASVPALPPLLPTSVGYESIDRLLTKIREDFPENAHSMLFTGVKTLTDYQDPAYAEEYLTLMAKLLAADRLQGGAEKEFVFTVTAAKYVAVSMAYDDVIWVADVKTREGRFLRIRRVVGGRAEQPLRITDYIHPRMDEFCALLPKALGLFLESRPWLYQTLGRWIARGRRVRTDTIFGFLALYLVSMLRPWRRANLRHARETAHRNSWLATVLATLEKNYELAVALLVCRRLVKGYSNTHERGKTKFDRLIAATPRLIDRKDGAERMYSLLEIAQADERGTGIAEALKALGVHENEERDDEHSFG